MESDFAVLGASAIGLGKTWRVDEDACSASDGGATLAAREGAVDAVEVDADLGFAGSAIEMVGVDSIRVTAAEAVDVADADAGSAVEDAISAVAVGAIFTVDEGADGMVVADAGVAAACGAIAMDLNTPRLSTR